MKFKNNNNTGGDGQQQLRRSARIRKLNQLVNEGKPAAGGEVQPAEDCSSSKKNRKEDGNNLDLQIVQLPQENAEREIAGETEERAELPKPMKIQLPKETWFDLLAFVPRHQLGEIAPQVGDRKFAVILQSFLHNYGQITLDNIWIGRPRPKDRRLYVRSWSKSYDRIHANLELPDVELPKNIKNFLMIELGYLDTSVLDFLQKFQQNSLFGNVNLNILSNVSSQGWLTLMSYLLPLINNINSIFFGKINTIGDMYKANSELTMDMLEMARILAIKWPSIFCNSQFEPKDIAVLNRWLYTARADGKPRMLILPAYVHNPLSDVLNFINGHIKLEFSKAKSPVSFFIRIIIRDDDELQDICCIENVETKENLVIKSVDSQKCIIQQKMVLISRYPSNAGKKWVEENEKEAVDWDFDEQNRRILLDDTVRNAIPWNFEHFVRKGREAHYRHWKNDRSNSNSKLLENHGGKRDNDGAFENIECRRSKRIKK